VPKSPNGTLSRKTARQSTAASTPPSSRPKKVPVSIPIWLMPMARPRWSGGKASVRMAAELAMRKAPPTACISRKKISWRAAPLPWPWTKKHSTDPTVKIANPAL
jgi:hypothetical protein